MNLEELTQSQMMLLAILVSFVTSIATGIATVSLLQEGPQTITQTVNRVVERTVERVVEAESQPAQVITKETKVVVTEADLIAKVVNENAPLLVRVYEVATSSAARATTTPEGEVVVPVVEERILLTRGAIVDTGRVLIDGSPLADISPMTLEVVLADETTVKVSDVQIDEAGVGLITLDEAAVATAAVTLGTKAPALGSTIVSIGGLEGVRVESGIITDTPSDVVVTSLTRAPAPGAALFTVTGEFVGISTGISRGASKNTYISVFPIDDTAEVQE